MFQSSPGEVTSIPTVLTTQQLSPIDLWICRQPQAATMTSSPPAPAVLVPIPPPPLDLRTVLESDIWGIKDFHKELEEVDQLVQKCHQIKNRLTAITQTVGTTISSSMLFVQFQKWRTKKLKNQIKLSLENLLPKVVYVEESIRMWFEAIVMKKWNVRHETFKSLKDLEGLLVRYSSQREMTIERQKECREMSSYLKNFIRCRNEELNFLEV
jgi:hypothetical protein